MKNKPFQEELELDQLRKEEEELLQRAHEIEENRRRLAEELQERENTIPPLEEIRIRKEQKRHEAAVTSRAAANIRRDQSRSLILLILLIATLCSLITWVIRAMQGG